MDVAYAETPGYAKPTQYATLGADATAGVGIGVRRASLLMDRSLASPSDDDGMMHFDFLNITAGAPDDTWTTGDYTALEALLTTWWGAAKAYVPTWWRLHRYTWHRVGPGLPKPNYAERIVDIASPVAGIGATGLPPQCATAITFRTGVRHSWGRTYLPFGGSLSLGRANSAHLDIIAAATKTLFDGALSTDFHPVVVSKTLNSALGIDTIELDDNVDIIRRRRWKHTVYRKLLAA